MQKENNENFFKDVDWEKTGVYIAVIAAFITLFFYIADMKERTRAVEVEISHLKEHKHIP